MKRLVLISAITCGLGSPLRAQSDLSQAFVRGRDIVAGDSAMRSQAARPAAVSGASSAEPGYHGYSFAINSGLRVYSWTHIFAQPAVLRVSFDMEDASNNHYEHRIKNVTFKLELAATDLRPTAYTLSSVGPDSVLDFYPPDPDWGKYQEGYAVEQADRIEFFIESHSNIDARAGGSVFEDALTTVSNGKRYGAKAELRLYPFCSRDMSSCQLGQLTGVDFEVWGLGWVRRMYPDFRMATETPFSLSPVR